MYNDCTRCPAHVFLIMSDRKAFRLFILICRNAFRVFKLSLWRFHEYNILIRVDSMDNVHVLSSPNSELDF